MNKIKTIAAASFLVPIMDARSLILACDDLCVLQNTHFPLRCTALTAQSSLQAQEGRPGMTVLPKLGSIVYVPRMQGEGKVVAAKGKEVTVSMGLMTLKVQMHEIQELTAPKSVKVFK
ncbi:hypothetical protein MMC07_002632 [Pseudocyphellaria aurata]|nr:hypothetical protein [Pseudocyphellaria aurata]